MIFSVKLPDIALAHNAVFLQVTAGVHETMRYTVYRKNSSGQWEAYFNGSGIADSVGSARFNISSIISQLVHSQHITSDTDDLIHFPLHTAAYRVSVFNSSNSISVDATAVYGAVGTNIFRRLLEKNSDIFKNRFFNSSRKFPVAFFLF
jgi:hypothetical protein